MAVVPALDAYAHVSVSSPDATPGGFGKVIFRVPNESESANTTAITVQLPADTPFPEVNVGAMPGWTATTTTSPLPEPVEVEGFTVTEAVSSVTWTADGEGLPPEQFAEFQLSVGPFPDVDQIVFTATQTYSDGEVVSWSDPTVEGQDEPEHPAPVLSLAAAGEIDERVREWLRQRFRQRRTRVGDRRRGARCRRAGHGSERTPSTSPRRMKRALIPGLMALGGVLAAVAVSTGDVSAHATLESADPANGSMLAAPPDHVELVFSENVGKPAALAVLDPAGNEVAGGELQVVDHTMSRTYDPATFEPGVYTISYQVTSADGHPISGTLTFMVHGAGESVTPVPPASSGTTTDASPTVVIALAALLALALGAALLVVKRVVALPDGNPTG